MTRTNTECSNVSARTCYLWRTLALALFIVAIQCSIANAQTEPEGEDGDGPAALSSQYFVSTMFTFICHDCNRWSVILTNWSQGLL